MKGLDEPSNKRKEANMLDFVDELEIASNAYRTEKYIVTQRIAFRSNKMDGSMIISMDVFYKRTKERDVIFEKTFASRIHINGKRLHATMSTRSYVE